MVCFLGCKPQMPPTYLPTQRPVLSSIPTLSPFPDDSAVVIGAVRDVRRLAEHPLVQEALQEVGLTKQAVRPQEPLIFLGWDALKGPSSWLAQLPVVGKISLDALKMKQESALFASWQSFFIEGVSFLGDNAKSYVYDKKVRALLQTLAQRAWAHDTEWTVHVEKLLALHEKEWTAPEETSQPSKLALAPLFAKEDPLLRGLLMGPIEQKQKEDQYTNDLVATLYRGLLSHAKQWQQAKCTLDLFPTVWEAAVIVQHKPAEPAHLVQPFLPAIDLTPFLPNAPIRGQLNLQSTAGLYALLRTIYTPVLKEEPVLQTWKAKEEASQKQPQPVSVAFAYFSPEEKDVQVGHSAGVVIHRVQGGDMRQGVADVFVWISSGLAQQAHKNMGMKEMDGLHVEREVAHRKLHGWPVDRYEVRGSNRPGVKGVLEVVQIGDYLFLGYGETLRQMVDAFFSQQQQRPSLLAMERFPAGGSLYVDIHIPDLAIALGLGTLPFFSSALSLSATAGTLSAVYYQDTYNNGYAKAQFPRRLVDELGKGLYSESAALK